MIETFVITGNYCFRRIFIIRKFLVVSRLRRKEKISSAMWDSYVNWQIQSRRGSTLERSFILSELWYQSRVEFGWVWRMMTWTIPFVNSRLGTREKTCWSGNFFLLYQQSFKVCLQNDIHIYASGHDRWLRSRCVWYTWRSYSDEEAPKYCFPHIFHVFFQ